MKLDHTKRAPAPIPPPETPVKYAHLAEIDRRTALGTPAWNARNSSGAQRVDAIRSLHQMTGSHEAAAQALAEATQRNANQTIDSAQTRTIVRVVRSLET